MIVYVCVYTDSLPTQLQPTENHLQVAFYHTWIYLRISCLPPPPPHLQMVTKACQSRFPIASSVCLNLSASRREVI